MSKDFIGTKWMVNENSSCLFQQSNQRQIKLGLTATNPAICKWIKGIVELGNVHHEVFDLTQLKTFLEKPSNARFSIKIAIIACSDEPSLPITLDRLQHRLRGGSIPSALFLNTPTPYQKKKYSKLVEIASRFSFCILFFSKNSLLINRSDKANNSKVKSNRDLSLIELNEIESSIKWLMDEVTETEHEAALYGQ